MQPIIFTFFGPLPWQLFLASLLAWLEGKANKLYDRKQRYGDAL